MAPDNSEHGPRNGTQAQFVATRWSVILAAQNSSSPQADHALARLCEHYWYPAYAFLRRKGHRPPEAQDLTQGFFAHVLQREWLRNVGPEKGRFRTFVLRCLANYVANQPRVKVTVPIDTSTAEDRYVVEPTDHLTPDRLFELRWAAALLEQAAGRMRRDNTDPTHVRRFDTLLP